MVLDNKNQKDPSQSKIEFILNLFNLNKFEEARKKIQDQLTTYPNSSILYNILGAIFASENEFDKAIKNYEKAFGNTDGFIYSEVLEGRLPGGIEFYLPLFFSKTDTLFDYLPKNTILAFHRYCPAYSKYIKY